ncbi:hypothetical protein BVY03_04130 [bacterium K02(2017)]|nr:hypothetical protein BVY03_04130 [bacterium K02(2017)]
MTKEQLKINEIFYSIQGESYLSGLPCIFIRLTGCDLRCTYCDTKYAYYDGQFMEFSEIIIKIKEYPCYNVLLTGGEPLLQKNTSKLAQKLIDLGYKVAIETSGNHDISVLPNEVVKIMDLKTPGSGEDKKNDYKNISKLTSKDEIKFVVVNNEDTHWAIKQIKENNLDQRCHVSISPTDHKLHPSIADEVLNSGRKIRHQFQMHKVIWPNREKGY